ncbi:conserved repeat domain-containing protein [Tranquillimonas rosea]|uniref:Conserved repeat domain-containing protein n=1 Tax=Tranquillimonas rosea TaxID=641238 RepID=A0A1H9SPQ2_9RHOB|nr:hypothetical protein [Tranquillimonas rosea]SER86956.1 conserved repeat domain-containing protein [Tranquillimonas rosea]
MPAFRLALLAVGSVAGSALAQGATAETTVSMNVVREVVTDAGETEYQPVETAVPGDPLIYRIQLENTDPVPANSVGLSLPLDESLAIDPTSVSAGTSLEVAFSADGGESFAPFEDLTVEVGGETRQAQATDLTHLRVTIDQVEPQSDVTVEYDAVVR